MRKTKARIKYERGRGLKENYEIERMPRCVSFNLVYSGSIAGGPAISDGYKDEGKT